MGELAHTFIKIGIVQKLIVGCALDNFTDTLKEWFVDILIEKNTKILGNERSPADDGRHEIVRFFSLIEKKVILTVGLSSLEESDSHGRTV